MKLFLILCVNFTFIFIIEAGLIKELIETVKEDVHGLKTSIHNAFSKEPVQNLNGNKGKPGILTNIVNSVENEMNKVHDSIHNTVHNILPFKKYKNKENGEKIDIKPANDVNLKPEDNVYYKTTTEKTANTQPQNYSSLIDVRFVNVSPEPLLTVNKETRKQNNLNIDNNDGIDLSTEAKERNTNELNGKSISNNSINKNIQNTRDGLIFSDQNEMPALKTENKIDKYIVEDKVVFPGTRDKINKANDVSQYNELISYNNNSIDNSRVTRNKNCAEGLVKAADGSCKEPVVINMNKNATDKIVIINRDNFVGNCLQGTGRALDGSCQVSID